MVSKRLSAITEGRGSWFNNLTTEGRIHGSVNPQGTVTYRGTHTNLGQVPSVHSASDKHEHLGYKKGEILLGHEGGYGAECRELFSHGMDDTWSFMGCDMSGIEFRLLAHYLHQFDGGALTDTVLNGDIHSVNQKAAGLPTRDLAKTFIYAFIYGGGDGKLGSIVGGDRGTGAILRAKFLQGMPAIATLETLVTTGSKTRTSLESLTDARSRLSRPMSPSTIYYKALVQSCPKHGCENSINWHKQPDLLGVLITCSSCGSMMNYSVRSKQLELMSWGGSVSLL